MNTPHAPNRCAAVGRTLTLALLGFGAVEPLAAQTPSNVVGGPVPYLDNDSSSSYWGQNVELDGTRALVAYGCNSAFGPSLTCPVTDGPAEVWFNAGGNLWAREAILLFPNDLVDNAEFGKAIAFEGDWAIVGAPRDATGTLNASGRVFVYHRDGDGTWSLVQTINAVVPVANGNFGRSLALEGDRLLIGEPRSVITGIQSGSAWLFHRDENGAFGDPVQLITPGATSGDSFGAQVALLGDLAMVSAPNRELAAGTPSLADAGAVATFDISGVPAYESLLLSDASAPGLDQFGFVMRATESPSGDILAVGAPFEPHGAMPAAGAVHCYRRVRGAWQPIGVARGTGSNERIDTIAISGDLLAVGGQRWGGTTGPGRVYLYHLGEVAVTLAANIEGPESESTAERTGSAVALNGDSTSGTWLFRTIGDTSPSADWGRIRAIRFGRVANDGDGDGLLNGVDVTVQGETDCDGNLVPDAVELATVDCDADGALDACQANLVSIASLPTTPTQAGWGPSPQSVGSTAMLLCKVVVPEGTSGRLVSYGTKLLCYDVPAATDVTLGVYRDPNGDGVPNDLELIDVGPIDPSGAEVEIRRSLPEPIDIDPGSSIFVLVAFNRHEVDGGMLLAVAHPAPFALGESFTATLPKPDFANLPGEAFAELGFPGSVVGNPYVTAQFASTDDLNTDGVIDACVCLGDFDQSGAVDAADLATLIGAWGQPAGDLNDDDTTDAADLAILLAHWGGC